MIAPRTIFAILLVVSLLGIAACDAGAGRWWIMALGLLYAAANVIVFLILKG